MESVIDIKGLSLAFTRDGETNTVLSNFDLTVARGKFVAIVGPSGVGKSTLLRVIAGLANPGSGEVRIAAPAPGRTSVALVFQDARLLPWRRVISNAAFGLERTTLSSGRRRERAAAMLDLVGLRDFAQRWPHQLSGGQRQRVALARALAVDPEILLMDEPFSALDAINRETLQDELLRVWRATSEGSTPKTVIFVTHDIEEAAYLADRVVVLSGSPGRIVGDHRITAARPRRRGDGTADALVSAVRRGFGGELVSDGGAI